MARRHISENDPREFPRYEITETAGYLGMSLKTLQSWVKGRHYPTNAGNRFFSPLVKLKSPGKLSFFNLVEIHLLLSTRKKHRITMPAIREAIDYINTEFPSDHPLLSEQFLTDGKDLFVRKLEQTINITKRGQLGIGPILDLYLQRIDRDRTGLPIRLFPVRMDWDRLYDEPPRVIVINPKVSSGRPVVQGTGVVTTIVNSRFRSGEGIEELSQDYGLKPAQIEEVIRYANAA